MCLFVIGSFNLRGKQCARVLGHWSVVEDSVGGLLCHHHHHGPAGREDEVGGVQMDWSNVMVFITT